MKNNDFEKELSKKMSSEEIALPESLSAENIEKLINEKGGIADPKRIVSFPKKSVAKWLSAAAVFVIIIGVAAALGLGGNPGIEKENINDAQQQEIIENHAASSSDYSAIHKTVLTYYKEIYNSYYTMTDDEDGIFDGFLDNFGQKNEAAMDMVVSNSSTQNATGTAPSAPPDGAEGKYSETNTQVKGVDEADIVKTDGEYIYYIEKNTIRIVKCSDAENMTVVGTIKLEMSADYNFLPSEMYLYKDTLVVVHRETAEYQPVSYSNSNGVVCDCMCLALKTDTVIKCFDISDKENPKETFTHKMTGDYISSRITDGKLITVAQFAIPYNSVEADDFDGACEVVKNVCVPEYSIGGGELKKIPAERIKVFDEKNPTCYTVTSILNLDDKSMEPKMNALLGGAEEIYCTREEIFVAEQIYSVWSHTEEHVASDDLGNKYDIATRVHKMEITNDGVNYVASVTVGGMCINQFSMDKNGDYFRIATNGRNYNGNAQKTMVYVVDKDMKIVGFLDNIAPSEQMKSARFMGNVLYLVTFMQTDPLFVVDLSVPDKPEIKGELKIPGFSTYLHPADDGLLIGVGEGGTMTGTDGTAKISLFDVSDPYNLKEIDNYTTGVNATFSGNHKEFVVIDENTFAATLYYNYADGKVVVFSITDGGIIIDNIYNSYNDLMFGNTRAVFIDENIFVVNNRGILSYKWGNEEHIGEIRFY